MSGAEATEDDWRALAHLMRDGPSAQMERLERLYSCRQEGRGQAIKLSLRAEQRLLLRHLVEQPHVPAYVIKSRRLGISTAVDTLQVDCAATRPGWRGIIIDQTQADATKKMVDIVRFAWDSLPWEVRDMFEADKRNDGELRVRRKGQEQSRDRVIYAGTAARGGDASMLHVSEWGPIAALDAPRSAEIRSGAFPAARRGMRVVETTWMGGKSGDLWDMVKPIMENNPNAEGKIFFFPWHGDPAAVRYDGWVGEELEHYFRELAGRLGGRAFSQEQKQWYAAKAIEQGIFVKREYPSTLEEAMSAPVEGAIYADLIMRARAEGRIGRVPRDTASPVFASWDLGWNDATCVWLWQTIGRRVIWLRALKERGKTAAQMVEAVRALGWPVAYHYLPHDAESKVAATGISYRDAMVTAGVMSNAIKVVPRSVNIWDGINALRDILGRSEFDAAGCEEGVADLERYHTRPVGPGGVVGKEPVHDESSHMADACRTAAEALTVGMVNTNAALRVTRNIEPLWVPESMATAEEQRANLTALVGAGDAAMYLDDAQRRARGRRPTRALS